MAATSRAAAELTVALGAAVSLPARTTRPVTFVEMFQGRSEPQTLPAGTPVWVRKRVGDLFRIWVRGSLLEQDVPADAVEIEVDKL